MANIIPSSDLRNKYQEISKQLKETREPIHITVNGREDTTLLSTAEYKRIIKELELLQMIAEAEDDIHSGRISDIKDTFNDLRANLAHRKTQL